MLEARLDQAQVLKKTVDAIRDLVQDCNFDCNDSGIALQAMDNSHVALVSMLMSSNSFSPYRCDRNIALGINLNSLTKVLRAAQNDDILTIKAEDAPDSVNLTFENADSDRISEYDIKLMDIDQEHLGIPETSYAATISMPSAEFQRICRDLSALSESGMSSCMLLDTTSLFSHVPAREPTPLTTLPLEHSLHRMHERRRHLQMLRRHRQRLRHPAQHHQRRRLQEEH